MEIRALRPTDGPAFADYKQDYLTHDLTNPYSEGIRKQLAADVDFDATYARLLANMTPAAEWRVPQIEYYLFTDAGQIAGKVSCRLGMTPALAETGGHIGYTIAPSQRGHGYVQQLLAYALDVFRARHEPFVIITAYAGNGASRHVIEKAGGVLQKRVPREAGMAEDLCIYNIAL